MFSVSVHVSVNSPDEPLRFLLLALEMEGVTAKGLTRDTGEFATPRWAGNGGSGYDRTKGSFCPLKGPNYFNRPRLIGGSIMADNLDGTFILNAPSGFHVSNRYVDFLFTCPWIETVIFCGHFVRHAILGRLHSDHSSALISRPAWSRTTLKRVRQLCAVWNIAPIISPWARVERTRKMKSIWTRFFSYKQQPKIITHPYCQGAHFR